jgi:hypothetical protein
LKGALFRWKYGLNEGPSPTLHWKYASYVTPGIPTLSVDVVDVVTNLSTAEPPPPTDRPTPTVVVFDVDFFFFTASADSERQVGLERNGDEDEDAPLSVVKEEPF